MAIKWCKACEKNVESARKMGFETTVHSWIILIRRRCPICGGIEFEPAKGIVPIETPARFYVLS